jgi:hypothetical protein
VQPNQLPFPFDVRASSGVGWWSHVGADSGLGLSLFAIPGEAELHAALDDAQRRAAAAEDRVARAERAAETSCDCDGDWNYAINAKALASRQ